jgi:spermidine/putrescine transport system ATP-binding protein
LVPPSPHAVELKGIAKRFAGVGETIHAVEDVNLAIRAGEFFTLLGPSGCGKTTTLRLIAGFEHPSEGTLLIGGESMGAVPAHLRPVNTVFQSYALFPHLTVDENVAFGLAVKGVPKAEQRIRVAEALRLVQMEPMGRRKPSALSGGQQQRVALARAIVNRPSVLLLDEPLGALDLKLRREMQIELKQMQRRLGITFVFVTHDQEEALTMSDRIAVMSRGRVLQVDDPVGIYERPTTRFGATFIGETNLFESEAVPAGAGHVTVNIAGRAVTLPSPAAGRVSIAIRPEALSFVPAEDAVPFEGVVADAIYIGTDRRYDVTLPTGETIAVRVQNSAASRVHPPPLGAPATVWARRGDFRILTD